MIMGDHTYKHVYENNTESPKDVNWADAAISPAKLDILFKRADSASQILRSAIKTNLDSPGTKYLTVRKFTRTHILLDTAK